MNNMLTTNNRLVPETYPNRLDFEGLPMTYTKYFRQTTQYDLGDGTWLFRMVRKGMGLSDADRLIYQADLGTLIGKAEGVTLINALSRGA